MKLSLHNYLFFAMITLFLAAAGMAAWWQQPAILLIPFVIVSAFYLLQNPHHLYYVLLACIPWSVEYNFTRNLGTDFPDEPLMLLTSLAIVTMFAYRGKAVFTGMKMHSLIVLIAIQLLWTVLTVIASTDLLLSVKYLLAKCWYMLAFIAAPLLLFRDENILKRCAIIFLTSMMLFMGFALLRHAQNGWTFEKINDSVRPFFRNHVNYSALLVCMVPLQIAVIRLSKYKIIRVGMSVLLCITIGATYFSYSRGAWLGLITGLACYWFLRRKLLFAAYLLFIVFCIASVVYLKSNDRYLKFSGDYRTTIFHTNFREHLIATYQLKDVSNAERIYRWIAAFRMAENNWKTGTGPATFYSQYKSYTLPAFKTWVSANKEQSTVHNYFLLLLVEQGVPGMLLFTILLGALFYKAQEIYHRSSSKFLKVTVATVASILAIECVVNFLSDLIETDKLGGLFYICVAVLVIADRKSKKEMQTDGQSKMNVY